MLFAFLNTTLLFAMPGGTEWILILLVVLLFFGGRKIPDLMRGIGRGVKEFNDAKTSDKTESETGLKSKEESTSPTSR